MVLSFNLEFFGDCNKVLDFYKYIFDSLYISVKTYTEMDMASCFGIEGERLDLIWKSVLDICISDRNLRFEMSDSLATAMKKNVDMKNIFYNPVICIRHNDDKYMYSIFEKIYKISKLDFEKFKEETVPDKCGIKWKYERCDMKGIYYVLTFDGFCNEVLSFYQDVFNINATEVVKYQSSSYADNVSKAGMDKIYSAILEFKDGTNTYALKLGDSIQSAMEGRNCYDKNALLFYQKLYNPVFTLRGKPGEGLDFAFNRLTDGGKVNRQLSVYGENIDYGSLIDRYGICWNIYISYE